MDHGMGRLDGFHVGSGLLAAIAGVLLLTNGEPAGWSFLLIAVGAALLLTQFLIAREIVLAVNEPRVIALAAVGSACAAVAIVYLTRAANDLPSLFPGHDGDSEHFRILPGLIAAGVAAIALGRAYTAARFAASMAAWLRTR